MLNLFNSLSGKIEPFYPMDKINNTVKMYNCGPTVYNYCHIGNFRAFLMADLLRRVLELNQYKVIQVMNITDVGHLTEDDSLEEAGPDKMAKALSDCKDDPKGKKTGKFDSNKAPKFKCPYKLAEYYSDAFFSDAEKLNLKKANHFPKATDYIDQMVTMIEDLLIKGFAYKAPDGTVYFEISKFPKYGKLSNNSLENLMAGAGGRVDEDLCQGKKSPYDFALWKCDPKHIMKWDTSLGCGFPGWHIECSAMSQSLLGDQLDIHTGGEDNKFPHHECEIAQSESSTNKKFVNFWLHAKHLLVDNQKMSKSKGNFYTIKDLMDKGFHPLAIRWVLQSAHYHTPLNFTLDSIASAQSNIDKLLKVKNKLEAWSQEDSKESNSNENFGEKCLEFRDKFKASVNNNLNLPDGLGTVFRFVNLVLSEKLLSKKDAVEGLKTLKYFDLILGVIEDFKPLEKSICLTDDEIKSYIQQRNDARASKNYQEADRIRDLLLDKGVVMEDSPKGTTWKPK